MELSDINVDWHATFGNSPPLWRMVLAAGIILIGLVLYLFLARYLPRYLSKIIRNLDKRSRKKLKKEGLDKYGTELGKQLKSFENNIKRFVRWTISLSFIIISLNALGVNIHAELRMMDYEFTIWMILKFFMIVILYLLFVRILLWQIIRLLLQAVFGRVVARKTFLKETRRLKRPSVYLFTIISIYMAIDVSFPHKDKIPFYSIADKIFMILGTITGVLFFTILVLFIFRIRYTIPKKIDIHASNALENIIKLLAVLIGVGVLLTTFGINPLAIFGALTFIGIAVGFGLQHSISNIMAGFFLAADKPFAVGDRIRVGDVNRETWGDVINIGLNTTRIRTEEGELVVIPNNYIASNEIWNYTRESPVLIHKINVGISYGSDWRLAKKIMTEVARSHPRVMNKPQPFVTMDEFAEFSINLKLWIWLKHVFDRDQVRSDLLESIKDRFDREGVEIPFPYRTVVYKKEIPVEKKIAEPDGYVNVRRYPSHGKDYFEYGDWHEKSRVPKENEQPPGICILVPSVNPNTAEKLARYAANFARKVNGEVTAMYVMRESSDDKEEQGRSLLNLFKTIGRELDISVNTVMETGDPVDLIVEQAETNNVDFIIIGKPEKGGMLSWMKEDIEKEIKARTTVPLIILPD